MAIHSAATSLLVVRRKALAAAAVGLVGLGGATAAQDDNSSFAQTVPAVERSEVRRLSMYDTASPPVVLVAEAPSTLQLQVSSLRKTSESLWRTASQKARGTSSEWIGFERQLEQELKAIRAPSEDLSPGLLYVAVSTLLGSIVTRNRLLPLRVAGPFAAFGASMAYFLPFTTSNMADRTALIEQKYVPTIYNAQALLYSSVRGYVDRLRGFFNDTARTTFREVQQEGMVRVEQTTGLRLQHSDSARQADKRLV